MEIDHPSLSFWIPYRKKKSSSSGPHFDFNFEKIYLIKSFRFPRGNSLDFDAIFPFFINAYEIFSSELPLATSYDSTFPL